MSLPRALSKLGLCSRTEAFAFIADGRTRVNDRICRDPALRVSLDLDRITVEGATPRTSREHIVIALHKPVGYVTTRADPQGRKTVYDLLGKLDRFVFPVGRLDKDTSGLLIFTDDHRLGERLTSPDSNVGKVYEVRVDALPDSLGLKHLRSGLDIGRGEVTRPAGVDVIEAQSMLRIRLHEGKNRQIRRMIAAVGLKVLSLVRVGIGGFELGGLPSGHYRLLDAREQKLLSSPPSRG
ncbi:MAG: pseudouridine synthase [Vicinamibacteria bacterium]